MGVLGLLVASVVVLKIVQGARSGELEATVLGGPSPWLSIALIGAAMLLAATAAPRTTRVAGAGAAGAFLYASLGSRVVETMLLYLCLAMVSAFAALVAQLSLRSLPQRTPPATSSRQVRAAVRAHERRLRAELL